MLRVGLTGGIGTGKSTVARIFSTLGIPVYFADEEARRLMNEDPLIRLQLIRHFGQEVYTGDVLDRKFLATRVFNDPSQLALLNSITHPPTIEHAGKWMSQYSASGVPFTLKEAAILFETGSAKHLDFIIGVYAPVQLRVKRIMARDGITAGEVHQRMDRQMDENIKMKLCDAVVVNDEVEMLIPQVLSLFASLIGMGRNA